MPQRMLHSTNVAGDGQLDIVLGGLAVNVPHLVHDRALEPPLGSVLCTAREMHVCRHGEARTNLDGARKQRNGLLDLIEAAEVDTMMVWQAKRTRSEPRPGTQAARRRAASVPAPG